VFTEPSGFEDRVDNEENAYGHRDNEPYDRANDECVMEVEEEGYAYSEHIDNGDYGEYFVHTFSFMIWNSKSVHFLGLFDIAIGFIHAKEFPYLKNDLNSFDIDSSKL
jgi:hypothetical protein